MPQYRTLINTSSGALHTDKAFLTKNSCGESVISANKPNANVRVAKDNPMMVRYCMCHPYESFLA